MKKLILLLGILSGFIISCGGDESNDDPTYSFADQDLQGLIDGQPFFIGFGSATESSFNNEQFSIKIYDQDEDVTNVCEFFGFGNEVSILFEIPESVGLYPLSFSQVSQTVTLFNPVEVLNVIASDGAVEILTITNEVVTGRIDAYFDDQNNVNGYFTVDICATN